MKNEISEPAWSGYEQEIPAHNGSVAGSNPAGDTKYKRVNLDELYVTIYFPDGRKDSVETDAYNRAIDDIKAKYGDLYEEPYAKPKYKLVDLDVLRRIHPIRDIANGIYSSRSYEVDGYNRAIDDIKSKYGDLYVEVK